MANEESYTVEELAKLLKISKLKVYDLIKKGELTSYRVGKQMRVDAKDLLLYKQRSKGPQAILPSGGEEIGQGGTANRAEQGAIRNLVITGQDLSLDLLAKQMERHLPHIRPLRSYVGSLDSLVAMYRGEADIVSTHLLDGETGEYNLPYIKRLLVGFSYLVVNMHSRWAGFYVQAGNPYNLQGWSDLQKPGLRIINREKGAGARVLLDEQLRLHGIAPHQLLGYETEQSNHIGVASKVAAGAADVGIGIEKAASLVGKVDFIPLIEERYDLVLLKKAENLQWIEVVLRILRSESFQRELRDISGYNLTLTGQVLAET